MPNTTCIDVFTMRRPSSSGGLNESIAIRETGIEKVLRKSRWTSAAGKTGNRMIVTTYGCTHDQCFGLTVTWLPESTVDGGGGGTASVHTPLGTGIGTDM